MSLKLGGPPPQVPATNKSTVSPEKAIPAVKFSPSPTDNKPIVVSFPKPPVAAAPRSVVSSSIPKVRSDSSPEQIVNDMFPNSEHVSWVLGNYDDECGEDGFMS